MNQDLTKMTDEYLRNWRHRAMQVRAMMAEDDPQRDDYDYTIEVLGRELSRREGLVA